MRTTGIFTISEFTIHFPKCGAPVYLIPFGDVHKGSPLHHAEKWKEFLGWARKKPHAYFLAMGDLHDLASTTERRILNDDALHESTQQFLEDAYTENVNAFYKDIEFMKGRIVGMLEGNHYGVYSSGITTTQLLCQKMGCTYLGVAAFMRLHFKSHSKHNSKLSLDVYAHHGMGAARLMGGSLNRVQFSAEGKDADVYIMGHDHKKMTGMVSKLMLVNGSQGLHLKHRKLLFVRSGSFLKGYEDGVPSYVADGDMNPTDLGVPKIEFTPKRVAHRVPNGKVEDRCHVDIHCSI